MINKLRSFAYQFDPAKGPLSGSLLKNKIHKGNCRLAVQDYFYSIEGIYIKPEDILLPTGFKNIGKFIKHYNGNDQHFFDDLEKGDIIYAERLRNKNGKKIHKLKELFEREDDWILHFHSAIYLGRLNQIILSFLPSETNIKINTPVIWHSSFISGGTSLWTIEEFCYYYRPVAAKRVL